LNQCSISRKKLENQENVKGKRGVAKGRKKVVDGKKNLMEWVINLNKTMEKILNIELKDPL
jgi:hypothetical protein